MVAALVPAQGRLLIVDNGVYGERIAQMCAQYQIAHERVAGDWTRAPNVDAIVSRLGGSAGPSRFSHLAIVHHETTTGRLNELGRSANLCRARGIGMLVDGVSSFGAEALDFADGSLTAVAATANKCLHGVPGVSFVIVRRTALVRAVSRTYYLDLGRLARLQDQRERPSRLPYMCTTRWSRPCENSPSRAEDRLGIAAMRLSLNRCEAASPNAASRR